MTTGAERVFRGFADERDGGARDDAALSIAHGAAHRAGYALRQRPGSTALASTSDVPTTRPSDLVRTSGQCDMGRPFLEDRLIQWNARTNGMVG